MNERLEAVVRGRVQLVMYRDFAKRSARALGLTGHVKNVSNGTVVVVAEGSREALLQFLKRLRRGSLLSHVENIEERWSESRGDARSFVISYD
jgi:acylphosphatase